MSAGKRLGCSGVSSLMASRSSFLASRSSPFRAKIRALRQPLRWQTGTTYGSNKDRGSRSEEISHKTLEMYPISTDDEYKIDMFSCCV